MTTHTRILIDLATEDRFRRYLSTTRLPSEASPGAAKRHFPEPRIRVFVDENIPDGKALLTDGHNSISLSNISNAPDHQRQQRKDET